MSDTSRRRACALVRDGLADWELAFPAWAFAETEAPWELAIVGFTRQPVRTLGGVRILPDLALEEVDPRDTGCFLLPGGAAWAADTRLGDLAPLLRALRSARVPLAAMCGATLALARLGMLDDVRHTSDSLTFLEEHAPSYAGRARYVDALAVADDRVLTAPGHGALELTRELILLLELYPAAEVDAWYDLFKQRL